MIKGKDPNQIMADLDRLDQMEYNVNQPPSLNAKVLIEKRRKLKETWDRVLRLYFKEDKDKYLELKRLEAEYEIKRAEMQKFFESVMSTQCVVLDDILMPSLPSDAEAITPILKKPTMTTKPSKNDRKPPGPPTGPPPDLSEYDDTEDEKKSVSFSDKQPEVDINDFLKEIENVSVPATTSAPSSISNVTFLRPPTTSSEPSVPFRPPAPMGASILPIRAPPAPPLMHGMRPPFSNVPPPPMLSAPGPSVRHPFSPNKQYPHNQARFAPPLGPRRDDRRPGGKDAHVVSERATIEAKPQLRNLSADSTRFTPVSLRVKRPENKLKKPGLCSELIVWYLNRCSVDSR